MGEPSRYQLRRWNARAVTLQIKASDLFNEMRAMLGDDHGLTAQAGGIMCDAAALAFSTKRDKRP